MGRDPPANHPCNAQWGAIRRRITQLESGGVHTALLTDAQAPQPPPLQWLLSRRGSTRSDASRLQGPVREADRGGDRKPTVLQRAVPERRAESMRPTPASSSARP